MPCCTSRAWKKSPRSACRVFSSSFSLAYAISAIALHRISCCPRRRRKRMQMHIRHETRYRYERPVKYSVQSLHLTPRRDLSQRALSWTITAPGRRLEQVDAYGNISHLLTIEEPHREIQIIVRGVVETVDTEGRQDDGPLSPLAYLAPTQLTAPSEELRAFAQDALKSVTEPRERALALAEAVFGAVRYKSGTSDVQDSAAVAFRSGEGVCQDHRSEEH